MKQLYNVLINHLFECIQLKFGNYIVDEAYYLWMFMVSYLYVTPDIVRMWGDSFRREDIIIKPVKSTNSWSVRCCQYIGKGEVSRLVRHKCCFTRGLGVASLAFTYKVGKYDTDQHKYNVCLWQIRLILMSSHQKRSPLRRTNPGLTYRQARL